MATPAIAANAYASLARMTDPSAGIAKAMGGGEQAGPSFGAMLKDAIGAVAESGRKSDAATQSMAVGKANIVDVVTAVAETEVAVNTLVSVRDKVVQAYEEIMRMPI
jgi:flagellar hook-basal body complex protein FliE